MQVGTPVEVGAVGHGVRRLIPILGGSCTARDGSARVLMHAPVGMNVFVIKSVVNDVSFTTIFKGVLPFVATDIDRLIILIAFPIIALWLPSRMH